MKRFAFVFLLMGIIKFSMGTVTAPLPTNNLIKADKIYISIDPGGQKISLLKLSTITPKEFSKLTGRKMNFIQRIGFSLMQKKLRRSINGDSALNGGTRVKLRRASFLDSEYGFNFYGFSEGLLLGPLGVLSMYIISRDVDETLKRNRMKWAWIGAGVCVLLFLALFLLLA